MKLSRLNVVAAVISSIAACMWLALGEAPSGIIWLVCSLVWLTLAFVCRNSGKTEPHPVRWLAHRFSRLLLWS